MAGSDDTTAVEATFALPSARHLTDLTAFFNKATINKDGSVTMILKLPADMAERVLVFSASDGMALNVRVWETRLPDGMEALAAAVGLTDDG